MTDFVDVKLSDSNDISFDANGDFELVDGFETSLNVSLFADARADSDEVNTPQLRRGWWGNLFLDVTIGSKLWFLDQAQNTVQVLVQAQNSARLSLQWLLDQQYDDNITVTGTQEKSNISLFITIEKAGTIIAERSYQLWRNTINNL